MKMHYAKYPGGICYTACGLWGSIYSLFTTRRKFKVTCKNCQRTKKFNRK